MARLFQVRSPFGRAVAVTSSLALFVSQAAAGMDAAWVLMLPHLRKGLQQTQTISMYTDSPTPVYYGDNPSRDEDHRGGLWTDEDLLELNKQVMANQAEWGAAGVSTNGRLR